MNVAYSVRSPRNADAVRIPHSAAEEIPYVITTTIQLKKIDFDNFTSDMRLYRDFLEGMECFCSYGTPARCILVRAHRANCGILIAEVSEGKALSVAVIEN